MPQTILHCFTVQFVMLFQMVCSIFLTVLHPKTLLLIGCKISTANQIPTNEWFLMATQRANRSTPSKRGLINTELKTGVILFVAFCLTRFIPWQVVTKPIIKHWYTQNPILYLLCICRWFGATSDGGLQGKARPVDFGKLRAQGVPLQNAVWACPAESLEWGLYYL